jgi:predicted RNase H-like nuclease (RuvC/YqgF family)
VIVGIDPGINTGYSVLDLSGRLLASGCEKEASDERIINLISKIGIPVLIASDTNPASSFVQKMAARLNAKVFSPRQSLTKLEKRGIGKGIDDPHIRDSYAAAVKAYRRYANRLRQIEAMDVKDKDELKRMVIVGKRIGERLADQNI